MLDQKSQMGPPFDRQGSQTSYKSAKIFRLSSTFTKQNTSPDYSHDLVMQSDKNIFNSSYI